jgi:signal transduction histidine kinase
VLALAGTAGLIVWAVEVRLWRVRREHASQRALSRRLIETQENERKRIAAELHDSLGQNLLVIKNRALLGMQQSSGAADGAKEQLGEISRVASASLAEVREISHGLRPYQLDRLGLTKALQAMVAGVAAASGVQCVPHIAPLEGLLDPAMEIHCYRIVQELLNNVVAHSNASEALVSARVHDGKIALVVKDDGCGFDVAATRERATGVGLTDIAERVRILNGTMRCDSQRAKGTCWTVEIPVSGKGIT